MIPVCGHLIPNKKAFDTAAATRPVSGRVADDFNANGSLVQWLQAGTEDFMRCYKVLKNAKNSLSKNAIFVVTYEGTFSGSAKMTPDFRKYTAVVCRIYKISDFFRKSRKNGVFYLYIFERNVLYYGGYCNSNKDDRQNAQVRSHILCSYTIFQTFLQKLR